MKEKTKISVRQEMEYGMMLALSAVLMEQNIDLNKFKKKFKTNREIYKSEIVYEILKEKKTLTSIELQQIMNLPTRQSANNLLNKLVYRKKAKRKVSKYKNKSSNFEAINE